MSECHGHHERYTKSAASESDEQLMYKINIHQTSAQWQPGGEKHSNHAQRIWMRACRREARKRGLL